jgi:hypothetical protein
VGNADENALIPLVHSSERVINRVINYTLMPGREFRKRTRVWRSIGEEWYE